MKVSSSVRFAAPLLLRMLALSHAQEQPSLGVPVPPSGAGPWVFDTAEQHKVRVSVVTKGLSHPWAIAFLPDGGMLVTERPGRLRIVREGVLESHAISGVPTVRTDGNGGLMDVALHPQFADNRLVYLTGSSQRSVQLRPVYMANKSSINSNLRGWRTPSVSGEELQSPGVRPTGDGGIARGLPVPRG